MWIRANVCYQDDDGYGILADVLVSSKEKLSWFINDFLYDKCGYMYCDTVDSTELSSEEAETILKEHWNDQVGEGCYILEYDDYPELDSDNEDFDFF